MSVTLSIKGVPDELAERLRQRAASNHRSLQGELMALLEAGVNESIHSNAQGSAMSTRVFRQPGKAIEQVAAELRARFPEPIQGGPLAVDIIRADRDSR
jgi:plasmid stability protein